MTKQFFTLLVLYVLSVPVLSAQSVLLNGDFEQVDPAIPNKPAHWDLTDGLAVKWADAPVDAGGSPHGKAIRMDTSLSEKAAVASYAQAGLTQWVFPKPEDNAIAETYGISFYSELIPVIPGKTYRVTFDYRSESGTNGKLWFRAYDAQKKRVYEGNVDCVGQGTWKQFTGLFHPTKYRPNVAEFKIMLYTYFPPGVAWFDNVKVEAFDE